MLLHYRICDPFFGSATRLLAEQAIQPTVIGCEKSLAHVDVALCSWQQHYPKNVPTLLGSGQRFLKIESPHDIIP